MTLIDANTKSILSEHPVEAIAPWREKRLVYRNQPLNEVLGDLQRHYRGNIVLEEPSLGEALVSGTLKSNRLEHSLRLLQSILPINIQLSPKNLVISKRPEP